MGGREVGGTPSSISAGGAALSRASAVVGSTSSGISSAGASGSSAAGEGPMVGAISRFAAAFGELSTDLDTQLRAAALLANNAAADLATAGGNGPR